MDSEDFTIERSTTPEDLFKALAYSVLSWHGRKTLLPQIDELIERVDAERERSEKSMRYTGPEDAGKRLEVARRNGEMLSAAYGLSKELFDRLDHMNNKASFLSGKKMRVRVTDDGPVVKTEVIGPIREDGMKTLTVTRGGQDFFSMEVPDATTFDEAKALADQEIERRLGKRLESDTVWLLDPPAASPATPHALAMAEIIRSREEQ